MIEQTFVTPGVTAHFCAWHSMVPTTTSRYSEDDLGKRLLYAGRLRYKRRMIKCACLCLFCEDDDKGGCAALSVASRKRFDAPDYFSFLLRNLYSSEVYIPSLQNHHRHGKPAP